MNTRFEKSEKKRRLFYFSKGMIYFDKKTERTFFFVLTILMLLWGMLVKFGVFVD